MMGHNIYFYGEIWLIIPKLSLLPLLIWSTDASGSAIGPDQYHCIIPYRHALPSTISSASDIFLFTDAVDKKSFQRNAQY